MKLGASCVLFGTLGFCEGGLLGFLIDGLYTWGIQGDHLFVKREWGSTGKLDSVLSLPTDQNVKLENYKKKSG